MEYYGWIDLRSGKYIAVVKIEDEPAGAYVFNKQTCEWVRNDDRLDVRFDTTMWDDITEEEALKTIREISGNDQAEL